MKDNLKEGSFFLVKWVVRYIEWLTASGFTGLTRLCKSAERALLLFIIGVFVTVTPLVVMQMRAGEPLSSIVHRFLRMFACSVLVVTLVVATMPECAYADQSARPITTDLAASTLPLQIATLPLTDQTGQINMQVCDTNGVAIPDSITLYHDEIDGLVTNSGTINLVMKNGDRYVVVPGDDGTYLMDKFGTTYIVPHVTVCEIIVVLIISGVVIKIVVDLRACAKRWLSTNPPPVTPTNSPPSGTPNAADNRNGYVSPLGGNAGGLNGLGLPSVYSFGCTDLDDTNTEAWNVSAFGMMDWKGNPIRHQADVVTSYRPVTNNITGEACRVYLQSSSLLPSQPWQNADLTTRTWTGFRNGYPATVTSVVYDTRKIPFETNWFEIVCSNDSTNTTWVGSVAGLPRGTDAGRIWRLRVE